MGRLTATRLHALRRAVRPTMLSLAAVALGLGIHVLGAGSQLSCAAVLIAGMAGLVPTLLAHHTLRSSLGSAVQAALIVSLGQLAMHISLTAPALSPQIALSNTQAARLLLAHGLVTTVVVTWLLGLQRTLHLVLEVSARLRAWLRVTFGVLRLGPVLTTLPRCIARPAITGISLAYAHGRRGPPLLA